MSKRDDIIQGKLVYTEKLGWVDTGQWHSVKSLSEHQKNSVVFSVSSIFVDSASLVSLVGSFLSYGCGVCNKMILNVFLTSPV